MLSDSKAIIMCGISGSGKTVFSRELEKDGFVRISADELIWDEYGDSFPQLAPDRQHAAYIAVGSKIMAEVDRLLTTGSRIVVDATMCKRTKRDSIVDTCRSHGIEPLIVYMKADEEVLRERLASRKGLGPNDQKVNDTNLMQYITNFEPPENNENYIIIESRPDNRP